MAKAKPEEEKNDESKTNEDVPAENGDAKAEEVTRGSARLSVRLVS